MRLTLMGFWDDGDDWQHDTEGKTMSNNRTVRFEDVLCLRSTDKAILVLIDGEEHWIPQSQVDDDSEVYEKDDRGTLIITEWIAEQKNLI